MAPSSVSLLERYRGSLLGLAIGDAIGHPTEFLSSVARIQAKYGPTGVTGFEPSGSHPPGTFTDDTQMTIAVARALVRAGHKPLEELMTLMGEEFVAWAGHPTNNRAPGGTCLAGCRKLRDGAKWRDAGVKESKGCGAAMRAAPVGLMFFDDDDALVRVAAAQSVLTHSHPTGIASSVAAAAPVAWVCKGNGLAGMLEYTKAMVRKVTDELLLDLGARAKDVEDFGVDEMLDALHEVDAALGEETDDVCSLLGGAWVGEEAVATALWCVLKANGDFAEAVLRGANSSGDSDSIACIAGSIAGALGGAACIRQEWRDGVERAADLDALAHKLHDVRTTGVDVPSIPGTLDFFGAERPRAPALASDGTAGQGAAAAADDAGDADEAGGDADEEPDGDVDPSTLPVDELERLVAHHNRLYWELAAPVLTDVAFDRITRALQAKRPNSDVLRHLGPKPDAGKAVRHPEPMLSLDKCYDAAELAKWAADLSGDVLAMPKIDGLACTLRYDASGSLEVAATRGDGEQGEDITPNARAVAGVLAAIDPEHAPLEVRGEVFMSLAAFEKHKGDKANPRNLAAGALRQKDPNATKKAGLSFLAYDVRGGDASRQQDKLALVRTLGFPAIDVVVVPKERAMDAVQQLAAKRDALGYETDGVVVMANAVDEQRRLGATAHHPRWAIAWKFQGEEGTSVLRGIEWSVARTGTITPVALVDAVQLSGVTVTRATLHHRGFLAKLGLTVGATIAMVRRGGVIPHVERVVTPGEAPIALPTGCPSCGAAVVEEGDFLMCGAPASCQAARVGRLLHFLSAADVQGLGEAIVEEAVQRGLLKTPADLYALRPADLAGLERCGDKSAQKIVAEIDKARTLPLEVLLRSLGIASLGKTAARAVAERFETLSRVREATATELAEIRGVGDVVARAIVDGLEDNRALLDALAAVVTVTTHAPQRAGGPLAGASFVFTGALTIDRKHAEARVKALGATVPSSVTKTLTHLVVGGSSRDAPSTKQKAAEKLVADGAPIAILDEAAFLALMASHEGAVARSDPPSSALTLLAASPPASSSPCLPLAADVLTTAQAPPSLPWDDPPPPTAPPPSSVVPAATSADVEPVVAAKKQLTLF